MMPNFIQQLSIDMVSVGFWEEMTPTMLLFGILHMLIVLNFLLIWSVLKNPKLPKILREPPLSIVLPSEIKNVLILVAFYLFLALVLPSFAIAFLRF